MSSFNPKQIVYGALAEVAKAIGHPHRLELLEHIAQGRRTVEELAEAAGLSFANASRHLQILRKARLVDPQRRGKHVLYSLAGDLEVLALTRALGRLGERNVAEIRQTMTDCFGARDTLAAVSREELREGLRGGMFTVLDVRPGDEFALGHLPDALNIPILELERRLADLPKDREIVAYCRGPYCILSFEAVAVLRARGYRARRLVDGFPEWRAAGLTIETAA